MKNKVGLWKLIPNLLIVAVSIAFVICLINMLISFGYKNREKEDPVEEHLGVFEYELGHKAYDEVLGTYYAHRMYDFYPQEGYEDIYRVAEYAHTVFMSKVYEAEGDTAKTEHNDARMKKGRAELGAYAYTADEIDSIVSPD